MKLVAFLLLWHTMVSWAPVHAQADIHTDGSTRKLGFQRLILIVSAEEAAADFVKTSYGGSTKATFRIKGSDKVAGTYYDTTFLRGTEGDCTGTRMFLFKNLVDSILVQYVCGAKADVISGGTGEYVGALGENRFNFKKAEGTLNFSLKILK